MNEHVILLSIPGLRAADLSRMPALSRKMAAGDQAPLVANFPAVTWPVQANMLTGVLPNEHGVVANGFYWRSTREVEMWTATNDKIERPQIWDILHRHYGETVTSAAWFPMLSKGCGADYICMPAPVHNPDGSESLWCYTRPSEIYGVLRDTWGHFPLQHFWGPLANIRSTAWIADSATWAAQQYRPNFFYIYLPHLDYAAQKFGPDSEAAHRACEELDQVLARMFPAFEAAYEGHSPLWLAASEYAITPVSRVGYPNRVLRDHGWLRCQSDAAGGEVLDLVESQAWALVDHQAAHVFIQDASQIGAIADRFRRQPEVAEVLVGDERAKYGLDHARSGEVILVARPDSWFAYYWWLDDRHAPTFARTVDIHRKPGYDPVELHFDMATKSIPLDATLIRGSHGAPALSEAQRGVLLASQKGTFVEGPTADTDICEIVLRQFGI